MTFYEVISGKEGRTLIFLFHSNSFQVFIHYLFFGDFFVCGIVRDHVNDSFWGGTEQGLKLEYNTL